MGVCPFLLSLLLLFISSAQVMYYTEGRSLPKHLQVAKDIGGVTVDSMMIGSRPPTCQRRCVSCGHCEAVQVPVSPSDTRGARHAVSRNKSGVASISDDTSNYKPMSWKCKCGERILNP